ncbi:hypothetical protein CPB85DRAFT_1563460 [Mucidula mucida]|nr:hypothetical protein CPB85DRAFT_1563460 [Mucidula mucida]
MVYCEPVSPDPLLHASLLVYSSGTCGITTIPIQIEPFTMHLPPSIPDRSSLPCFHSSTDERSLRILFWLAVWCTGGAADALFPSPDDFPYLPEDAGGNDSDTPSLVASQTFASTSEPFSVNITHFPPQCQESKKRNLQGFWTVTAEDDNPTIPTTPEAPVYHHINADTGSLPEISMLTNDHTLAQWVPGPQMRAHIQAILPMVSERLRLVPKKKLKGLKAWSCVMKKGDAKRYPAPTWIEC